MDLFVKVIKYKLIFVHDDLDCKFTIHLHCVAKVPPNCSSQRVLTNEPRVIVKVKEERKSRHMVEEIQREKTPRNSLTDDTMVYSL